MHHKINVSKIPKGVAHQTNILYHKTQQQQKAKHPLLYQAAKYGYHETRDKTQINPKDIIYAPNVQLWVQNQIEQQIPDVEGHLYVDPHTTINDINRIILSGCEKYCNMMMRV